MASAKEPRKLEIIENYAAPEIFATDVARAELVDGCVRLTFCSPREGSLETKCFLIIPLNRTAAIGRQCLTAAAELHNASQWIAPDEMH